MITQLKKLWFNEAEAKIYLLILEHKKILPSVLSYISKINRTTIYSILKKLKEKNLIPEDIWGKNKNIIALPVQNLNSLIEKEKDILTEKESLTRWLIWTISTKFDSKKIYIPKIQYIEEDILEDFLYDNLKKWFDSMLKNNDIWWGFQDPSFVENYWKWIDYSWKKAPKNIELKLFTNIWEIEEKMLWKYKKRQVKSSPFFWEIDSTMWILGDYIITMYTKESPYYLVETYNPLLSKNLRNMFRGIWGK